MEERNLRKVMVGTVVSDKLTLNTKFTAKSKKEHIN